MVDSLKIGNPTTRVSCGPIMEDRRGIVLPVAGRWTVALMRKLVDAERYSLASAVASDRRTLACLLPRGG